jgi:hypothetical protein
LQRDGVALWGESLIWVRRVVAVVLTVVVFAGFVGVILMLSGVLQPNLISAPGLSATETEALSAPFNDLMTGHDEALKKSFVDGVKLDEADAQFAAMRKAVPGVAPISSRLVQWAKNVGPRGTEVLGVHEQSYPDWVVRIRTDIFRPDANSPWRLVNLSVDGAPLQALAANKFSLANKPPLVIVTIVGAILIPLIIWLTAIACLLLNDVKQRWLWFFFILIGLTTLQVGLNGAWKFQPISFLLFGGGAFWSGSAFEPWVFSVALPVGAILFWIMRALRRQKAATPASENA